MNKMTDKIDGEWVGPQKKKKFTGGAQQWHRTLDLTKSMPLPR